MDWLIGLKDLGYPALISLALLYVLTTRIESFRKTIDDLGREVAGLREVLGDLRIEMALAGMARRNTPPSPPKGESEDGVRP